MAVIVETSVWVDIERKRLTPSDVAAVTGDEPVFVSPVTIAELQYGVMRAKSVPESNRRAAALAPIKSKPCLIIDRATGEIFGRIASQLDSKGRPSKHRVQDLWIASQAIQHDMKVLTKNPKDFDDIPGVEVLSLAARRQ